GTSEQTVARRYHRLHEAGAARVVVLPTAADQGLEWIVRIGARPGAAGRVATALAARHDVSWVRIMSGGGMGDWSAFDDPLDVDQAAALEPAPAALAETRARDSRPEDAA